MVPIGLKPLLDMRMKGARPDSVVWLLFDDRMKQIDWWLCEMEPQAVIRSSDPVGRIDLRCLVGLHAVVEGDTSDKMLRLADRARDFADRVTVHQFDRIYSDYGMYWQKGLERWVPLYAWLAGEIRG